ncbi:MAG TPA: acetamidase/formamidase family protein [Chloroflexota bacterium]|jgi:acetamidase/formamidase|nr:acetamidase/formamidase family protein [Chloroflexota bacterium]
MHGCAHGDGRVERLHDELVDRAANLDRLTHHDQLNPAGLEAFLSARRATRRDVLRFGGLLAYTTVAFPLGAQAATQPWLPIAGGAASQAPLFDPNPQARTHTVDSIPGETVVLGQFDVTKAPILTIDPGDIIVYRNTLTHFLGAIRPGVSIDEIAQLRRDNPGRGPHSIIGPIAVRGAEPGDVLEFRLLRIDPIEYGFNFNNPADLRTGALPDEFPEGQVRYFDIDKAQGVVRWDDTIALQLAPFQGTLGVAPDVTEPVSSVPPGPFGGNTDLREQVEGTRIFIPVFKPGALIFTGDSHALQGDGEVNLTAVETAMREVRVQVLLHKAVPLSWPIAETPTHWIPLATHTDLNEAFRQCLRNVVDFLVRSAGLTPLDAYGLASVAVSFRITQVVNVNQGVHGMIAKALFAEDARREIDPLRRPS